MDHFNYRNHTLYAEDVAITDIIQTYGTPCYIYSRATLERHFRAFEQALHDIPHAICYAVKANGNLAILKLLADMGAGFDIVSGGELERVLLAGGDPQKVIFSGIGKTTQEIKRALEVGIGCFNIESLAELNRIAEIAHSLNKTASIAFRVNPNVDAETHPHITTGLKSNKFGIAFKNTLDYYKIAKKLANIHIKGIAFHIGSQLLNLKPIADSLTAILHMVEELTAHGITLDTLDIGGGLGVRYHKENPPTPEEYGAIIRTLVSGHPYTIIAEPGRAIAANAGILVTQVEYLKENNEHHFAIVDAGMNDLVRPVLYDAWHEIIPVMETSDGDEQRYDIVGPVCESGDFFGKQRPLKLKAGDLLAIRSTGAYGFAMSSNYNTRPRACEILVDGSKVLQVRRRETLADLLALETIP